MKPKSNSEHRRRCRRWRPRSQQQEGNHQKDDARTAVRCDFIGGTGRPERALTIGCAAIVRAGRLAATYEASTANNIEATMTSQGSWNTPTLWCALASSEADRPTTRRSPRQNQSRRQ